jgi:hypothetical protein
MAELLVRWLRAVTAGARASALVGTGLAAGLVLAAAALGQAGPDVVTVVGAGSSAASSVSASPHGRALGHAKTGAADDPAADAGDDPAGDKPDRADDDKADKADDKADRPDADEAGSGEDGVHGRCVAAVARDPDAVGGPHHNHGWAVSRAAHTCPHPAPSGSAGG